MGVRTQTQAKLFYTGTPGFQMIEELNEWLKTDEGRTAKKFHYSTAASENGFERSVIVIYEIEVKTLGQ